MQPIKLNKTYTYVINGISFGNLSQNQLCEIFSDGRAFSHFIEPWLATQFPIQHVKGCKEYDHVDLENPEVLYDAKTFTRGGCKFCPSNMLGAGRHFDSSVFVEKAKKLIYIIVSNIDFPEIKIRFVRGEDLATRYPKGSIALSERHAFFIDENKPSNKPIT